MRADPGRGWAVLLAALVLLSSVGAVGMVAAAQNSELNWDARATDDPYIYEETLTVDVHNLIEMVAARVLERSWLHTENMDEMALYGILNHGHTFLLASLRGLRVP